MTVRDSAAARGTSRIVMKHDITVVSLDAATLVALLAHE